MADNSFDLLNIIEKRKIEAGSPVVLVLISALAILIWMFWAATSSFWAYWAGAINVGGDKPLPATTAAGAWGDSFGGFNALVGALGFGAVAITLHLQYRSMERQKVDLHIERFEGNFFRLLDLMRSLRDDLKYTQTSNFQSARPKDACTEIQSGHDAIEAAYHELVHWIFKNHKGKKIQRNIISAQYENYIHSRFEWCFSPYYRIIYTILYNTKNNKFLSEEDRAYYGNILRSQLTSFEIGLIAFNATSPYSKDLADLITNFRLLKYLPKKRRKVLGDIFPDKAYEARS